jgi:hypothetical protein
LRIGRLGFVKLRRCGQIHAFANIETLDLHLTPWQYPSAMGQEGIEHAIATKASVAPGWTGFVAALSIAFASSANRPVLAFDGQGNDSTDQSSAAISPN